MIVILCAMSEEKEAVVSRLENIRPEAGPGLFYHGKKLDDEVTLGKFAGKELAVIRSGVGKVYAALICQHMITVYCPELVINVGVAGAVGENITLESVIVSEKAAYWDMDVPGWERSFDSPYFSFEASERFLAAFDGLKENPDFVKGNIVTGDCFVYKKSQVNTIRRYFPSALCAEMEGAAVAACCYANAVGWGIIRSISDITFTNNNYKLFEFNLEKACQKSADLCLRIIEQM